MNILRDAAHLQTQLRLYDGLVETRHTLLRLRPQLRQNWIALAVAYHLSGNLAEAKSVLEQYERIVKVRAKLLATSLPYHNNITFPPSQNVPDYDVEMSEILLYHVRVLEDLGEYTDALALLDANAKSRAIIDRVAIQEFRGEPLGALVSGSRVLKTARRPPPTTISAYSVEGGQRRGAAGVAGPH